MNPVLENIKTRRSIRAYTEQKVEPAVVEQVVEAALRAPSAMGRQTWQFTVLEDPQQIARLAAVIAKAIGKQPGEYNFYKPAALVITSNAASNHNGAADCACAMQNMMLASHALGLGSVWINQAVGVCQQSEVREAFASIGVPSDHLVYGMCALGHFAGVYPQPPEPSGKVVWVDR